jgi:hypothetical protein
VTPPPQQPTIEQIRAAHPMPWRTATFATPGVAGPAELRVFDGNGRVVPLFTFLAFTLELTQRIAAGPKPAAAAAPTPEAA